MLVKGQWVETTKYSLLERKKEMSYLRTKGKCTGRNLHIRFQKVLSATSEGNEEFEEQKQRCFDSFG